MTACRYFPRSAAIDWARAVDVASIRVRASAGTNIVMTARDGLEDDALIRRVRDGLYVGRVWYTYPINGQRAGDFTCTVSGDSHVIRNGKPGGTDRAQLFEDQFEHRKSFQGNIAAGKRSHAAIVWGSSEAFYVPAIACEAISVSAVGKAAE